MMLRVGDRIDTVAFYESSGGDSGPGADREDIRKRKLRTAVSGFAAHQRANMFLGGSTRQLTLVDGKVIGVLGYHGSYKKDRQTRQHRVSGGDYFVQMTDGKMDETFVERFDSAPKTEGV